MGFGMGGDNKGEVEPCKDWQRRHMRASVESKEQVEEEAEWGTGTEKSEEEEEIGE